MKLLLPLCALVLAGLAALAMAGPGEDLAAENAAVENTVAEDSKAADWAASEPTAEGPAAPPAAQDDDAAQDVLAATFAGAGIHLDLKAGTCAVPVSVEIRDDLLEYLVTLPHGAAHEAMFLAGLGLSSAQEAEAWATTFNTALLALGAKPGRNAEWVEKDPPPSEQERREGVSPWDVTPPQGDGFYLHAAWREGPERYLYRIEDLVRDLESQRTMRRAPFVYLGSRMMERPSGEEAFAAGVEGNLINVSFFPQGNTLLTGALPECLNQTTWLPNAWLLPPRGSTVFLVLSRERLEELPASLAERLPDLGER